MVREREGQPESSAPNRVFDDEAALLRARVSGLVERFQVEGAEDEILAETLEELAVVIEELQTQNAELIEGRSELERERQRYHDLFDSVPEAFLVTDAEGIILDHNATATTLLGSPSSALNGRPLVRYVAQTHRRAFYAFLVRLRQVSEGGTLSIDLTVRDHRLVPATLRATVGSTSEGRTTLRWLVHDRSTDIAIDELRMSEERLRTLFDSADIGIVLCDEGGSIVFINPRAMTTLGFDADATAPTDWLRHVPEPEREVLDAKIAAAIRGVGGESVRRRIIDQRWSTTGGPSGVEGAPASSDRPSVHWVDHGVMPYATPGGKPNGFVSTLVDVTKEHEALGDLARSRDFAAAIVDTTAAVVVVADTDGSIRLFNPRAQQVSGWSSQDAIGRSMVELLIAPERRDHVAARLADAANGRFVAWEETWLTRSGEGRRIAAGISPLKGLDGSVEAIVATGLDVTDQRRLERHLAQTERLHSIGRLASGIAHDFNNTLAVLLARAERIGRRTDDAEIKADIDGLRRTIDRSKTMIGDLLTFSGRIAPAETLCDINLELSRTAPILDDLLGEKIDIELDLTDDDTVALIDPGRFDQIITNLAINARDAMADGGTLTLTTDIESIATGHDRLDRAPTLPRGDYVRVKVSDTGSGIPAGVIDRIFEPYFTTKELGQGSGVGLAMVYGIMQQAGGEVIVESEPERGTQFTLWLQRPDLSTERTEPPAVDDGARSAATVDRDTDTRAPDAGADVHIDATTTGPVAGPITILVVEDNAEVRTMVVDQLRDAEYATIEADRGDTAIAVEAEPIDLVISDIDLPGADGFAVAEHFQKRTPAVPVLLISGVASIEMLRRLPADVRLLAKPFTRTELLDTCRELLAIPR